MMDCNVVLVTNISPTATYEQITTLFGFLGSIDQLELFPRKQDSVVATTKVAFVKFRDPSCVGVSQHLTSTVFIDRALMCVPYTEGNIPEEVTALQYVLPVTSSGPGMSATTDQAKVDELRRTVYVGNLDHKMVSSEQVKAFFASCGEVRSVRMAGDEIQSLKFAFVEFASVESAQSAMQLNGAMLGDRPVKVSHSNHFIIKPPGGGKTPVDATAREIDEAMRRVREAQSLISKALEGDSKSGKKRSRSRSRSRSRHRRRRSKSRDRSRRRRSRSRSRGRSRRSRSRSRSRRRSRRSRSRSRDRKRKKTRSRSPRRRSGSGSPSKKSSSKSHRKDRKRDRDRDRDRDRKRSKQDDKGEKNGSGSDDKRESKTLESEQNGTAVSAET